MMFCKCNYSCLLCSMCTEKKYKFRNFIIQSGLSNFEEVVKVLISTVDKKSGQDILLRVVLCDSWLSISNEQNR